MKLVRRIKISARVNLFALVSTRDFDLVSRYRWFEVSGYALCHPRKGKTLAMHRLVMRAPKGSHVDHRDGNGLNNVRSNLRVATHQQNMRNRTKRKSGFSRFKGVAPSASKINPWQAYITINQKYVYLGSYADEVSAARAYNKSASEHFGEFAKLNEVSEGKSRVNTKSRSSKFPGVCWHKAAKKWHARLYVKGQIVFSKMFDCEKEAFAAWKSAKGKKAAIRLDVMADYL